MEETKQPKSNTTAIVVICIIILVILVGLVYFVKRSPASAPVVDTSTSTLVTASSSEPAAPGPNVTVADINSGTYEVWGQMVTMTNGTYKNGTNPATSKNFINTYITRYALGDINGDGHTDALVETATSLGNDYSYELHSLIKQGDVATSSLLAIPVEAGYVRTVDDITIDNELITMSLSIVPPDGAACCPTIHAINQYRFNGTGLTLVSTSTKE